MMSQRGMAKFLHRLTMVRSKKMIRERYGKLFWKSFQADANKIFRTIISEFPDIGNSMFAFNYAYAPGYVAWYKAMEKNGLDTHERDILMLLINEKMLLTVPKPLLHAVGRGYFANMRKMATLHIKRQEQAQLHPYDWTVSFENIDKDNFNITISRCGFITYAGKYQACGMLPAICQVDYMISHYMHVGFERTKILGAGDTCCDGKYCMTGSCAWDREKRLQERK